MSTCHELRTLQEAKALWKESTVSKLINSADGNKQKWQDWQLKAT